MIDVTGEAWATTPVEPVSRPIMRHEWRDISFLHWRYEPGAVSRLVPDGLEVETFDGSAWISLTPFRMTVRGPVGPAVPWLSFTPETNVRTYVRDRAGRSGIWFLSLDIARLPVAVVARTTYRLPYMWSRLTVDRSGSRFRYTGRRRAGGPPAAYDVVVARGRDLGAEEVPPLERFLTARFALFARYGRFLVRTRVAHEAWPLWTADVVRVEQSMFTAAGLPQPAGEPLGHWSPGVAVDVAPPDRPVRPPDG
jgi:uncharacterized protein YqjF (DUF2071 family)